MKLNSKLLLIILFSALVFSIYSAQAQTCEDDDATDERPYGDNYYVYGTCTDRDGDHSDYCYSYSGTTGVIEFYCYSSGDTCTNSYFICTGDYTCSYGACVPGCTSNTDCGDDNICTIDTCVEEECVYSNRDDGTVVETEVCCDGLAYIGDCCSDLDCDDGETCADNNVCEAAPPGCTDTDVTTDYPYGDNYYIRGTCYDEGGGQSDYCFSETSELVEYYCNPGGDDCTYEIAVCTGDYICSNGACVPECTSGLDCTTGETCVNNVCVAVSSECTDTDATDEYTDGKNYYVYGTCTDEYERQFSDSCHPTDPNKLREYYCDSGDCEYERFDCLYGCVDRACVECTHDTDCTTNEICAGNVCKAPECSDGTPSGEYNSNNFYCDDNQNLVVDPNNNGDNHPCPYEGVANKPTPTSDDYKCYYYGCGQSYLLDLVGEVVITTIDDSHYGDGTDSRVDESSCYCDVGYEYKINMAGEEVCEAVSTECTSGDTQGCYTGPSGTEGEGECTAGYKTCTDGSWGSCAGQVLPETEVCDDTLDNDCDGDTDDDDSDCVAPECTSDSDCTCSSSTCFDTDWYNYSEYGLCTSGTCDIGTGTGEPCEPVVTTCDSGCYSCGDDTCDSNCGENITSCAEDCVVGGCTTDNDCPSDEPVCDNSTSTCVECLGDSDCETGETCNPDTYTCILEEEEVYVPPEDVKAQERPAPRREEIKEVRITTTWAIAAMILIVIIAVLLMYLYKHKQKVEAEEALGELGEAGPPGEMPKEVTPEEEEAEALRRAQMNKLAERHKIQPGAEDKVKGYIESCRARGFTDDQIKEALLKRGWKEEQVSRFFI